jgi:hypothetical protein
MVFRHAHQPLVRRTAGLAAMASAAAFLGFTTAGSAIARADVMDFCTQALRDALSGIPWVEIPDGLAIGSIPPTNGSSVSINSGNNVSVQSGPNNVSINSSSVGGASNNGTNAFNCCVNGKCCVSSYDGNTICTP